ncbi:MAG: hypothetical protein ACYC3G_02220 [Minisyncoccota bacterium]
MNFNSLKTKFKNKQDITFLMLGILMTSLVLVFIFYSINFLASEIKEVLNAGKVANVTSVKFDIEKIKVLEISKMQK